MAPFGLPAYLQRIGWGGHTRPTFETLAGVLRAHMAAIPFENLDVLLGRPVRLDLEAIQGKLVGARRGGYCFEHSTLLAAALEALGFRPVRHSARVTVLAPRTASPRTHMFLTVSVPEGTFVLDPGFGALAPSVPVPLVDGATAQLEPGTHVMVRDGRHWMLRAQVGERAIDAWASTLEEDNAIDFEMANHFTMTHPSSAFVDRLMLRALTSDGRIGVMNRDVTTWQGDGVRSSRLADRIALRALLVEHFGFDLPEVERLRVPTIPDWG